MKGLTLALAVALLASSALAQKKPPPPPAANPEIAFVDTKPKFPELKLAFEDLTGSFVIFRAAAQGQMPRYDLSPRGQNQVAVTSGGSAHLLTWSLSGTAVSVSSQALTSTGTRAEGASFSPDGTRIAIFYGGDSQIRIFDAATRQVLAEWPVPYVYHMTYNGLGSKITLVTTFWDIFELDPATGTLTEIAFTLGDPRHIGEGRGTNGLLVTYQADGAVPESLYLARLEDGAVVNDRILQGWDAQYNCNETKIVYRATGPAPPTYIYNVSTGATSLLTRNTDIRRVDYMPTC